MSAGRTHSLSMRAWIPGVALRLLLILLVVGASLILVPSPVWQGVAITASLAAAVVPRTMAAWVAVACLPFGLLLDGAAPERTALAILFVHAVHILASLSLVVPARSRLSFAVLLPTLRRFVIVQALAQVVALGVWALSPGTAGAGTAWIAPLAAAAVLAGVLVALRASRRAEKG